MKKEKFARLIGFDKSSKIFNGKLRFLQRTGKIRIDGDNIKVLDMLEVERVFCRKVATGESGQKRRRRVYYYRCDLAGPCRQKIEIKKPALKICSYEYGCNQKKQLEEAVSYWFL